MTEKVDEMCPPPESSSTSPRTEKSEASSFEVNCDEKQANNSASSPKVLEEPESGQVPVASQTSRDTGVNPENPHSLTTTSETHNRGEPLEECKEQPHRLPTPRNPITGLGLNGDGVGGLKPKKPKGRRDGNPVTGEGYKTAEFNNHTPSMNGANQIINKNRIPPGGYSSGLW